MATAEYMGASHKRRPLSSQQTLRPSKSTGIPARKQALNTNIPGRKTHVLLQQPVTKGRKTKSPRTSKLQARKLNPKRSTLRTRSSARNQFKSSGEEEFNRYSKEAYMSPSFAGNDSPQKPLHHMELLQQEKMSSKDSSMRHETLISSLDTSLKSGMQSARSSNRN